MSKLKIYKFNDLYKMSSGISSKPEQAGHGSQFVSFKTVFNNYFLPDILSEYMNISEKEKDIYSIKKGDIFLTRTSETLDELGMSCVALKDYPASSFSGFLKRLRPTQDDITYDKFMAFYLRSDLFRKTMTNNSIMTLRASFNEQIFSYLELILPDFKEQKKAGDFLYSLSAKIELNNRINSELEAMAKTLYDYWFVQFDFPDANGKPYKSSGGKMVWNEELKREIPKSWEVNELSKVLTIKYGKDHKKLNEGTIPVYGSGGIMRYADKALYNHEAILIPRKGSIGNLFYIAEPFWSVDTMFYTMATVKDSTLYYFYQLSKLNLKTLNVGTAVPSLTTEVLNQIKLLKPNSEVMLKFNSIVSKNKSQILLNTKQNQELASLRDWLLPMLMNGQVTVADAEEIVNEELGMVAEPGATYGK